MQGWYYGEDGIFALWECYLDRYVQDHPLGEDANMLALWQSVERWIFQQFPQTRQIITPYRDDMFAVDQYQAFLAKQGYTSVAQAAWGKQVTSETIVPND